MQKVILYPHGGSGNHGCEALVRSTAKILGKDYKLILASKVPEQDQFYGIDSLCTIVRQNAPAQNLISRLGTMLRYYLWRDKFAYERQTYREVLEHVDSSTICLSFGGDNYCYGKPTYIYIMNRLFRERGAKTILWGCSIEPDNIDDEMLDDLRGYDKIIVRESLTYNALKQLSLENVVMCSDPAFALECDKSAVLPSEFVVGNTVGLNLSPMAISYSAGNEQIMQNYRTLIKYVIEETDMNVALIPHVVWNDNDDRGPLGQLYLEFKDSHRISIIEDNNCERLKGVISKCRFVIAARTHASIAAYSTGIPTLVMGYSIKAKGIASDLFGTDEGYVLPVQNLQKNEDLLESFKFIIKNEISLKLELNAQLEKNSLSALSMRRQLC